MNKEKKTEEYRKADYRHSRTPWLGTFGNGQIRNTPGEPLFLIEGSSRADFEFIVKACNEYEQLKAENEGLKDATVLVGKQQAELERLKEEKAVLQSQVDNADINYEQIKLIKDKELERLKEENEELKKGDYQGIESELVLEVAQLRAENERLKKEKAELVGVLEEIADDCPNCDNVGYTVHQVSGRGYATRDMAIDAGDINLQGEPYSNDEWEQEQCEFCYTVKNSRFNIEQALAKHKEK